MLSQIFYGEDNNPDLVLGPLHPLAVFECDIELLIGDQELGADVLARVYLLLWVCADAGGGVPGEVISLVSASD